MDDNKLVLQEFKGRFSKISSISFRTFQDADFFFKECKKDRPDVVILDYYLGENKTANDIIEMLNYKPAIFIMSAEKDLYLIIKPKGFQFFYKDDFYVMKIAKAVIQYLKDKN